jgi:hypothetical protein
LSTALWEERFQGWSTGPSETETIRCANAERIIKDCLRDAGVLEKYRLSIFVQGSYANHTNVPQESDVDICVSTGNDLVFFDEYPVGKTRSDYGNIPSDIRYADFKADVTRALENRFTQAGVTRRPKCIQVHDNSYRVVADVVPAFAYRWYPWTGSRNYIPGIRFVTDSGDEIENYPAQHLENGIAKNVASGRRFKRVVRILKRLQFYLIDEARRSDKKYMPSYAVECLVYNIPNPTLNGATYHDTIRNVLALVYQRVTTDPEPEPRWKEVNDVKWLFHAGQPWSREAVKSFIITAWNEIGYS